MKKKLFCLTLMLVLIFSAAALSEGQDAASFLVGPEQYRTVGAHVTFGTYPQTETGEDRTPIEWMVMEVDEENHKTKYVRDFETSKPNEKWSTDVSEFHIPAGKLYLAPILDMYNDEIIAYDISSNPDFLQQKRLLNKAFSRFEDLEGLIFHSDQGWQYQMQPWHKALKDKGIIQSMSRKGNCLDNAPIENFFGKLKNEMFYGHEYEFNTLDQLKEAIEEYIEYYNTKRIKVKLKGLTPCEARKQALSLS